MVEKKKIDKRLIINGSICVLFILLSIILTIILYPILKEYQTEEGLTGLKNFVDEMGFLGVLILFSIQVIQIVIPFLPGQFIELTVGALYSPVMAILILSLGLAVATIIIYYLGKWIGRPFISLFLSEENEQKYSFLKNSKKMELVFFILFLIPGTPKDILIFFLPLLNLKLNRFIILSIIARIPGWILDVYMGHSFFEKNYTLLMIILILMILIGIFGYIYKDKIMNYLKKESKNDENSINSEIK